MKTKNFRNIEDEDPDEPWYPPNYDYVYSYTPVVTRKMWNDLDNKYKVGIRNFRINNINVLGRFGIWPDWNRIPKETRELYSLKQVGTAYKNDFMIYRQYVRIANSRAILWETGSDIIDPSERNKIYGIVDSRQWYWKPGTGQELAKVDMLPNGSPMAYGVTSVRPPWMVRDDSWFEDGRRLTIDPEGYEEYVYAEVSPVCRTIRSKRV